jgi:DNA-binding response OmpR family regulator
LRILIVDPEYLVALEAESLIQQRLGARCVIAMPRDLPAFLSTENFSVVIIDEDIATRAENRAALDEMAMPLVVLTFHTEEQGEAADALLVAKPFEDDKLVAAVAEAIRRASPPSETEF